MIFARTLGSPRIALLLTRFCNSAGSPVAKGAELRSELKVSSDLDIVSKLPGSAELAKEFQVMW